MLTFRASSLKKFSLLAVFVLSLPAFAAGARGNPPPSNASLTQRSEWFGITFFGKKAGYSRVTLHPVGEGYEIESEVRMRFRFLEEDKRTDTTSREVVSPDLALRSFETTQTTDSVPLKQKGRLENGALLVEVQTGGRTQTLSFPAGEPIYPESALGFYPLLHGLAVGNRWRYRVYSSAAMNTVEVNQTVEGFGAVPGKNPDSGPDAMNAWRISTRYMDESTTSWIADDGRALREEVLGGKIVSRPVSEEEALAWLREAAADKSETFLKASLIPVDPPLPDPDHITGLAFYVEGVTGIVEEGTSQFCRHDAEKLLCRTRRAIFSTDGTTGTATGETEKSRTASNSPEAALRKRFLAPSPFIQCDDARILAAARSALKNATTNRQRVGKLVEWVYNNLQKRQVDVVTALDALQGGAAECQGHAMLYTALARAAGIPTRVASGIAYVPSLGGFIYHAWAESLIDGQWVPVDPSFGQAPADALRLKLSEGEGPEHYGPILAWIGKARVRILSISRQESR